MVIICIRDAMLCLPGRATLTSLPQAVLEMVVNKLEYFDKACCFPVTYMIQEGDQMKCHVIEIVRDCAESPGVVLQSHAARSEYGPREVDHRSHKWQPFTPTNPLSDDTQAQQRLSPAPFK